MNDSFTARPEAKIVHSNNLAVKTSRQRTYGATSQRQQGWRVRQATTATLRPRSEPAVISAGGGLICLGFGADLGIEIAWAEDGSISSLAISH
jgi:hypothetical protein